MKTNSYGDIVKDTISVIEKDFSNLVVGKMGDTVRLLNKTGKNLGLTEKEVSNVIKTFFRVMGKN